MFQPVARLENAKVPFSIAIWTALGVAMQTLGTKKETPKASKVYEMGTNVWGESLTPPRPGRKQIWSIL